MGDTQVKPGEKTSAKVKRKRWVGAAIGFAVLVLVLLGEAKIGGTVGKKITNAICTNLI